MDGVHKWRVCYNQVRISISSSSIDRFTPEWSLDDSTVNAYTLGEKDPRQRIYVYNDEGVSPSSKQMCVHTFRCFSDPAKYIVDTIEADDIVNKDWEDNATLLIFPGGADRFYRVCFISCSYI